MRDRSTRFEPRPRRLAGILALLFWALTGCEDAGGITLEVSTDVVSEGGVLYVVAKAARVGEVEAELVSRSRAWRVGEPLGFTLDGVPLGRVRLVIEVRDLPGTEARARYYGISEEFELVPHANRSLRIELRRPGGDAWCPPSNGPCVEVEAQLDGVPTRVVKHDDLGALEIVARFAADVVGVRLSTDLSPATGELFGLDQMRCEPIGAAGAMRSECRLGVCPSAEAKPCFELAVEDDVVLLSADFVDANGYGSAPEEHRLTVDRRAPGVVRADVGYIPRADSPLPVVTAARPGTQVTVSLIADEPVAEEPPPTLVGSGPGGEQRFKLDSLNSNTLVFSAVVSSEWEPGAPPHRLRLHASMADRVGNVAERVLDEVVEIRPSSGILEVDQDAVLFERAPLGNMASPAPRFRIVGRATAGALPPEAFRFVDGSPVERVRVWAGPGHGALLGWIEPDAEGWPGTELSPVDTPVVYFTGLDSAGNESAPIRGTHGAWTAVPRQAASGARPHLLSKTSLASNRLSSDEFDVEVSRAPGGPTSMQAATPWRRHVPSAALPPFGDWSTLRFDAGKGLTVLLTGPERDVASNNTHLWTWDGLLWREEPQLEDHPLSDGPHDLVFDAARGRLLTADVSIEDDLVQLWAWHDGRWSAVPLGEVVGDRRPGDGMHPLRHVPLRLAYDSLRGAVLVLGRARRTEGGITHGILWRWDGAALEALWAGSPEGDDGPPPESASVLAYDSGRHVLVAVGRERREDGDRIVVWEWDGRRWVRHDPPEVGPSPDGVNLVARPDPGGGVLIYDGEALWRWDDAGWSLRDAPDDPSPSDPWVRTAPAMAPIGDGAVMIHDTRDHQTRQWVHDGRWREITRSNAFPPDREAFAMGWDGPGEQGILFGGGLRYGPYFGDSWLWDGSSWRQAALGEAPSARRGARLVSIPDHCPQGVGPRTLLIGGVGGNDAGSPVWAWEADGWRALETVVPDGAESPFPRWGHSVAYARELQKVVMFGGFEGVDDDQTTYQDTWTLDPCTLTWRDVSGEGDPEARGDAGLVWVPEPTPHLLLYGGRDEPQTFPRYRSDLWRWTDAGWSEVQLPPGSLAPSARVVSGFVWDPVGERAILGHGRPHNAPHFWAWNPEGGWLPADDPTGSPPARASRVAFDARRGVLVHLGTQAPPSTYTRRTHRPDRRPAVQLIASATTAGIEAAMLEGLTVRARCGGESPADGDGALLLGWASAGRDVAGAGAWVGLGENRAGLDLVDAELIWHAQSGDDARRFMQWDPKTFGFQCRSAGSSGAMGEEAEVALGDIEITVFYRADGQPDDSGHCGDGACVSPEACACDPESDCVVCPADCGC